MKIKVANLGAIGAGTIDLSKKINLLCGHNGTGKTYFSYLIYGLLRNHLHVKGDDEIADRLLNDRHVVVNIDFHTLNLYRAEMLKNTISEIGDLFGVGVDVCEKLFKNTDISFGETEDEFNEQIINASMERSALIQGVKVMMSKQEGEQSIKLDILDDSIPNSAIQGFRMFLTSFVLYNLSIYPVSGVAVFPVERNSIYTFSKELSIRKQEAMDNLQLLVDKEKKISKFDIFFNSKRYPLPVKDGLMVAEDLAEIKKEKSDFYIFAENLENELLHGKVKISNDGDIQFSPERSLRTVLPIQMSASIVKTLSSLVVYLKHLAKRNDLIIIDEPEINLHPNNQIIIARILARLANQGFRLLISTHSDYIIREFNNMVMLSMNNNEKIESIRKENGYLEDEYIKVNDIGVYSFTYKTKKSKNVTLVPLKVDQAGFAVDVIDNVIESQNEIAESLYYAMKYGKDEE